MRLFWALLLIATVQSFLHTSPGARYSGTSRTAYLPGFIGENKRKGDGKRNKHNNDNDHDDEKNAINTTLTTDSHNARVRQGAKSRHESRETDTEKRNMCREKKRIRVRRKAH